MGVMDVTDAIHPATKPAKAATTSAWLKPPVERLTHETLQRS
jgi:hypothetical protein